MNLELEFCWNLNEFINYSYINDSYDLFVKFYNEYYKLTEKYKLTQNHNFTIKKIYDKSHEIIK